MPLSLLYFWLLLFRLESVNGLFVDRHTWLANLERLATHMGELRESIKGLKGQPSYTLMAEEMTKMFHVIGWMTFEI